jgi:phosphohistidine phosphatase
MAAHLLAIPSWTKRVHPGTVIGIDRSGDDAPSARLLFYAAPGQQLLEAI